MSYALKIAGDAIADLRELDPVLQEYVLDELERLLAATSRQRVDRDGHAVLDFERTVSGHAYVVFMRLHIDVSRRLLTLLSVVALPHPG